MYPDSLCRVFGDGIPDKMAFEQTPEGTRRGTGRWFSRENTPGKGSNKPKDLKTE